VYFPVRGRKLLRHVCFAGKRVVFRRFSVTAIYMIARISSVDIEAHNVCLEQTELTAGSGHPCHTQSLSR
jgi:hypothetical protein